MRQLAAVVCAGLILAGIADAQWVRYPDPRTPRMADGKPDLAAPAPRTADGHPDLSGLWTPASFTYFKNIIADIAPDDVPFQPLAASVYESRMLKDDPANRCLPLGIPRSFNSMFKIVQTTGATVILYENLTQFREIFTDGRSLPANPNPTWFGYSVGAWDRDVFTVESTGFNDKTWLDYSGHPHTESLHTTERFSRPDFGHMELQVTIDDPGAYTRPLVVAYPFVLAADTSLIETICENGEEILPRLVGTDPAHPPSRKTVKLKPEQLSRFAGTYELTPRAQIVITSTGDSLVMKYPTNPDHLAMFAETETRFFFTVRDEVVEFRRDAGGEVTAMVIESAGNETVARKVR